jgi:DNA-binding MarR family transcriptional regulator
MKLRPTLTPKQEIVFDALYEFMSKRNRIPTHDQLAMDIGVCRTTVTTHLQALERKGYIRRSRKWFDMEVITQDEWQANNEKVQVND